MSGGESNQWKRGRIGERKEGSREEREGWREEKQDGEEGTDQGEGVE